VGIAGGWVAAGVYFVRLVLCDGGLTGWDARAALLLRAVRRVVVGVAVLGLASGGIRWDGLAMMMDGYGWACGQDLAAPLGRGWMDEPESLILAQSERWRHA
jgi:hypothetical protein